MQVKKGVGVQMQVKEGCEYKCRRYHGGCREMAGCLKSSQGVHVSSCPTPDV